MEKELNQSFESIEGEAKIIINFLSENTPEIELPIVDAILIFGHYDPRPAEQAAKLWKMGKAPVIIISGKGRDKIPAGFESEADFYASIIEKEGVPRSALVLEKDSTNTLENVQFGVRVAEENGIHLRSLIMCSLPPLLRRSRATIEKQFPNIRAYGSAFNMPIQENLTSSRLRRIIGEFDRLKEYSEKGDTLAVAIPEAVTNAIQKIKASFPNP